MKALILLIFCSLSFVDVAQLLSEQEVLNKREEHFKELTDTSLNVLNKEEIEHFGGLSYFPFDPSYQLEARFVKDIGKKFKMPTSTDRLPVYRRFGYIYFEIENVACTLEVYQNMALRKNKEYHDYLFIPFRDKTSGKETYGGGRYLDARIPDGDTLKVDFNVAYNPYCAYSHRYSCPIPPDANTLTVSIKAGEKTPPGDH